MRENTGRQTVTVINFVGRQAASIEWTPAESESMQWVIDAYADQHRANASDPEYRAEFGQAEVFEYEQAGMRIVALAHNGHIDTVWTVEDNDVARYHAAARTGRVLRVRYAKPSQVVQGPDEITRRDVEVQRVWISKAGHVMVTAYDRRRDDTRSFRADRITHTTLHRQTTPVRPSKLALAAAFQAQVPSVSVTIPAPRTAVETVSAVTDIYTTEPGTAAALEAPEAVQDMIAERYALGHQFAFVTV